MLRYAVLHHTGASQGDHYDFLVESKPGEGDLITFRLPSWPVTEPLEVKKLRDHRRIYLTYQGEVANDRGHVVRIAEGTAVSEDRSGALHIRLSSGVTLTFYPDREDVWIVRE